LAPRRPSADSQVRPLRSAPPASLDGVLRAVGERAGRWCRRRPARPAWIWPLGAGEVLLQRVRRRELVRDRLLRLAGAVPEASARRRLRLVPALRPRGEAELVPGRSECRSRRCGLGAVISRRRAWPITTSRSSAARSLSPLAAGFVRA